MMVRMGRRSGAEEASLVRGSVVVHRRRCGKASCRCASGEELHEATVLSYSEGGRTRLVSIPASEVAAVRAAVERFRSERQRLDQAGEAGRSALLDRLADAKGRRR
jgi:hypothetical protein